MNSDLEKFMKQLEVTLKTKLKFANDNYEKLRNENKTEK